MIDTHNSVLNQDLAKLADHWKSRLFINVLMLLIALTGLVVTDLSPRGG